METFLDKLRTCSERNHSLLCIGLDPDPQLMPPACGRTAGDVTGFNRAVIEATSDLVCAYKPNFAFYEALGSAGFRALEQTLAFIPSGVPTIADAKRGDIPNTARMYARAVFDTFGFDSVTVSPYMGGDSLAPFLEREGKGVWVLCRTSNAGAADLQGLEVDSDGSREPLYLRVLRLTRSLPARATAGLVVGATSPDEIAAVRRAAPEIPMLIPGVGSQGGDARAAVEASQTGPVVINASRSILYGQAGDGASPDDIRRRAMDLRDRLNQLRP